jgi:DNA (cytosine-5)-methyltransferase 1
MVGVSQMSRITHQEVGQELKTVILHALDEALKRAEVALISGETPDYGLSTRIVSALTELSFLAQKASTGFTNIVTCLAIKSAKPQVDIRYHQVQIQNQTERSAGFNFRGVSEKVVYPWLNEHAFEGAKSGWQTRTFERPKPYMLSYDENIGDIKESFLITFDEVEEHDAPAADALAHLIYLQLLHRESKKINLSIPRTQDIQLITQVFAKHFFYPYKSVKGASRLPVLALYAIYSVLLGQLARYQGMELRPLEEHSAADSQTGAVGDIEVVRVGTDDVFEAIEVKHNIALNERIIQDAATKIMNKSVDRYYILTTHTTCEPDDLLQQKITRIKLLYNCQLIANGVIPSIKYYLRLLSNPSLVFQKYVELLATDSAIKHEHREVWNNLAILE